MNYNEINKSVGNSRLAKIFGWIFLIAGLLVFITTIGSYIGWKTKETGYIKEYVYSDSGILYYEDNEEKVYVEKIYNTDDKIIELDIPDKKTAIMYCDKNNLSECIYFDTNNSVDQSRLNPIMGILTTLFLVAIASFLIPKKRFNKILKKNSNGEEYENGSSISSIYLFYVFLFAMGIGFLGWQLYNAINYFSLKNNNNITTATIYSEIYNLGADNDKYKPVSYYYVDNQKYVYVSDQYEDGNLNDNLGNTFDLYYNKNNPNKVSKKDKPLNFILLIIGICFTAFTFPFVFFKKKMEKRIDKNLSVQEKQEWKI